MKKRTPWYEKHGMTEGRIRELEGIALQYDDLREAERKLRAGEIDQPQRGNVIWKKKDPTGNMAAMRADKSNAPRIRAIEESARAAGGGLWREVLRNATCRGETWEKINPPIGRRQFYALRRRFFIELDKRVE